MTDYNTVLVPRMTNEETTVAIVKYAPNDKVHYAHSLLAAIRRAVAKWALTEDGKQAIIDCSEDFNIGDLEQWQHDPVLVKCLAEESVNGLVIDIYCETVSEWQFDDKLI